MATAAAIVAAIERHESENGRYDLILFGNEAADTGDYQVAIRVAHALGRPCASGSRTSRSPKRPFAPGASSGGGEESFELDLPAVVSVKEGINLPRYPSLPGRMRAKKALIENLQPEWQPDPVLTRALRVPAVER